MAVLLSADFATKERKDGKPVFTRKEEPPLWEQYLAARESVLDCADPFNPLRLAKELEGCDFNVLIEHKESIQVALGISIQRVSDELKKILQVQNACFAIQAIYEGHVEKALGYIKTFGPIAHQQAILAPENRIPELENRIKGSIHYLKDRGTLLARRPRGEWYKDRLAALSAAAKSHTPNDP